MKESSKYCMYRNKVKHSQKKKENERALETVEIRSNLFIVYVVVQFYSWFNFYFPLFLDNLWWCSTMSFMRQREIKFETRINLSHNIDIKIFEDHKNLCMGHTFFWNFLLKHYRNAPIEKCRPWNRGYPWCFAGRMRL